MGRDTVHFKCHHCAHCCTEVVCLPTPWDVIRIVRETGADPREFLEFLPPEDVQELPQNDPTWLRCGGRKYMMALRRDNRSCHFLNPETRFCSIYTSRPLLCRLYPFRLRISRGGEFKGFNLHKDVGCPRHKDGVYQTQPLYEIYLEDDGHQDDYWELVRVFNRKRHKGKKAEDFIGLFIEDRKEEPREKPIVPLRLLPASDRPAMVPAEDVGVA